MEKRQRMDTHKRALHIVDFFSGVSPADGRTLWRPKEYIKIVALVNDRLDDAVIKEETKIRAEMEAKDGTDKD